MPYATNRDRFTPPLELTRAPWPLAPLNLFLTSGWSPGCFDLRWDSPSDPALNSRFQILGVNIYRSFDSEYGPFHRLTDVPLGVRGWQDRTDIEVVTGEDVSESFTQFDDTAAGQERRRFVVRVSKPPIVVSGSQGTIAHDPFDVWVEVDGVRAPVRAVAGFSGEIEIDVRAFPDAAHQTAVRGPVPSLTSRVTATYRRLRQLVKTDLAQRVFYRVTTVGVPAGCGDCGEGDIVETPLEYAAATSSYEVEKLDWIWKEAIRRNRWILEQGGERVRLFLKKNVGVPCPCYQFEHHHQPLSDCLRCYGTGIMGGYEGPYEAIIAPDDAERRIAQKETGRAVEHSYEVWTGPSPLLAQRDFLVKLNGDRYSVGPVRFPSNRGMVLQQHFTIGHLDERDIRGKVPMLHPGRYAAVSLLPQGPEEGGPTPITDKANIPDERELRGRTPAWENTTYLWPLKRLSERCTVRGRGPFEASTLSKKSGPRCCAGCSRR